jgi:FtsH-binding integral membrane protein
MNATLRFLIIAAVIVVGNSVVSVMFGRPSTAISWLVVAVSLGIVLMEFIKWRRVQRESNSRRQ